MNNQITNDFFSDLFKFKNEDEETKHEALMISLQFISELNKVMGEKGIKKNKLAKDVHISPSYVTQLFNGDKKVSCEILAKFQKKLGIRYKITAVAEELAAYGDIEIDHKWSEIQVNIFLNKFKSPKGCLMYKNNVWTGERLAAGSENKSQHRTKLTNSANEVKITIAV